MTIHPYNHVQKLAGEIGCRHIGTAGNHAAAEYISSIFQSIGCAVEQQPYQCPSWSEQSTVLSIGDFPLEAYANTFSPSCDLSAPLLPIGSLREAECAPLAGKLVILYGDLSQNPLSPKAFFYAAERDLKLIALLEAAPVAGVITVNPTPSARFRMIEDPDFPIPSVTVSLAAGLELVRRAGQTARLRVQTHREQGQTANIIARLEGTGRRILICAHYDTKVDTTGALDNAGGAAVLLALAEKIAANPRRCAFEFVAFTGEEHYESPERDVYFQQYGASFGEITAAINIDGVGSALSTNTYTTLAVSPAFDALVDDAGSRYPAVTRVDPWYASNHFLFFSNGVPSLAFSSITPTATIHTPNDSLEWIQPEKLTELVEYIAEIVDRIVDKQPAWARPT